VDHSPGLIALSFLLAYLTGAIPTSVWVGKLFFRKDIRDHGSGNAGATNTMRVLGLKAGIPVLLFDIFKGWLSVKYISFFNLYPAESKEYMILSIIAGILAVTGHIYPVYAGFRGGKGVASIFGVLLALSPFATLCAAGLFFLVLFSTGYVSLGSMIAGISFPFWIVFVFPESSYELNVFSIFVGGLIIYTHRSNIKRLLKGSEGKATFLFRKK